MLQLWVEGELSRLAAKERETREMLETLRETVRKLADVVQGMLEEVSSVKRDMETLHPPETLTTLGE